MTATTLLDQALPSLEAQSMAFFKAATDRVVVLGSGQEDHVCRTHSIVETARGFGPSGLLQVFVEERDVADVLTRCPRTTDGGEIECKAEQARVRGLPAEGARDSENGERGHVSTVPPGRPGVLWPCGVSGPGEDRTVAARSPWARAAAQETHVGHLPLLGDSEKQIPWICARGGVGLRRSHFRWGHWRSLPQWCRQRFTVRARPVVALDAAQGVSSAHCEGRMPMAGGRVGLGCHPWSVPFGLRVLPGSDACAGGRRHADTPPHPVHDAVGPPRRA